MSPRERPVGAWNLLSKVFRADELWLRHREDAFEDDAAYQYETGRYKCLTGDLKGAREATGRAFELNREYRAKFVEDEDFDAVWRTFG